MDKRSKATSEKVGFEPFGFLTHVPAKWIPARRQERASLNDSRDSIGTGHAPGQGTTEVTPTNRGFEMRKIIYSVGAIAVIAATLFMWSNSVVVGPQAMKASAAGAGEEIRPSEATQRVSPSEIMVKHGKLLPTEYWSHPF
jgi:hypothetical protein